MKKTPVWRYLLCILAAFAGIALVLQTLGWLFRPNLTEKPAAYPPEVIRQAEKLRDVSFDPKNPPSLYVEVDYSEGKKAKWYPKGESPILAELVKEGKLPPVDQRVPEEPVVLRGCDGIGNYGGTWMRVANTPGDVSVITWRLAYANPMRWSPLGYPVVPHLAKKIASSEDRREWILTFRKGLRWSDGHPFGTRDILYWWNCEVNDEHFGRVVPLWLRCSGKSAQVEALDDLNLKVTFPEPNALFPEMLAFRGQDMVGSPEHYLRPYHPTYGNRELIDQALKAYRLPSPRAVYGFMKDYLNPDHPRLWPWIYRTYKSTPPQVFVRNPYYFCVDEEGNQLPYVDRVQFEVQDGKMLALSASGGLITMQARHIRYEDYTELMSRRESSQIEIYHWYPGVRSYWVINPNLNRRVDPERPDTKWKAQLLADKRFRQALSLAINRQDIIQAEFNGQAYPAQVEPGPESPYHLKKLQDAYVQHDPAAANRMLDELGLVRRDYEGMRTFPDGSRMTFYLDFCNFTGAGPAQFVVDDWGKVGVRCIQRERSRSLLYTEKQGNDFDFNVWTAESDFLPLLSPRYFVPVDGEAFYAGAWGRWFARGGFYGDPKAKTGNTLEPPRDHPMYRAFEVYEQALKTPSPEEQKRIYMEVLDIAAENTWTINIASPPPQPVVVKKGFKNVPRNCMTGYLFQTPGNAGVETFFFEKPADSPGAIADTRQSLLETTPRPGAPEPARASEGTTWGRVFRNLLRYGFLAIFALVVALVAFKHPYIGRRLLIMIPTMLVISVIVFTIIQLPPGDYLTTRIMVLQESGDEVDMKQIDELKGLFHFDEPGWKRYLRWLGLKWFVSFERKDMGLIQGHMGRSMETSQEVNDLVGDRIFLTVLISLGTLLFTWFTALPIGIYSAVRQYTLGDYALTFVGFIGMCVPSFLLALVLMALTDISGLFSAEYAAQPEWTAGKWWDLMKHIWIPVVVLGIGGTAGMIRIMRGNLLDELRKPYVITAMAKGVRPMKLLFKYPVRLALNPFISGIGGIFPQLVSGNAIVSIVLSLPTVGPLLLQALFSQDMYLAASMLMVLSLLGVIGTLVSDLLLLWLDPRIRFQGGTR